MSGLRAGREHGAVTFEVRVTPRSSSNRILGTDEGVLRVALTTPPIDGAANDALRKLVSKRLGVPKSSVEIVRGKRGRNKLLRVYGVDPGDLDFGED